jgi:hypothetical protein
MAQGIPLLKAGAASVRQTRAKFEIGGPGEPKIRSNFRLPDFAARCPIFGVSDADFQGFS